jgi:hypothetical protein
MNIVIVFFVLMNTIIVVFHFTWALFSVGVKKWAAEYNDRIVDEKLLDENIQGAESINYLLYLV